MSQCTSFLPNYFLRIIRETAHHTGGSEQESPCYWGSAQSPLTPSPQDTGVSRLQQRPAGSPDTRQPLPAAVNFRRQRGLLKKRSSEFTELTGGSIVSHRRVLSPGSTRNQLTKLHRGVGTDSSLPVGQNSEPASFSAGSCCSYVTTFPVEA